MKSKWKLNHRKLISILNLSNMQKFPKKLLLKLLLTKESVTFTPKPLTKTTANIAPPLTKLRPSCVHTTNPPIQGSTPANAVNPCAPTNAISQAGCANISSSNTLLTRSVIPQRTIFVPPVENDFTGTITSATTCSLIRKKGHSSVSNVVKDLGSNRRWTFIILDFMKT
jgi:hypothetical protein